MQAIILGIGDELVLGQTVDTNSPYLSEQLARRGISTLYHQIVADDLPAITRAIVQASELAPLVIITGGLGPTDDDLTRQALANAMGVELVMDETSLKFIEEFFARRGRTMPPRNSIQAMHPRGATVLPNSCGTAPGIKAHLNQAEIYVTPGVPVEMHAMFEQSICCDFDGADVERGVILTAKLNSYGIGESDAADKLGALMARDRNPKVGTTVSHGLVSMRVRSEFATLKEAQQQLDDTLAKVEQAIGPLIFGRDDQSLQNVLIPMLRERKLTVATAESCTGGYLAKMLTDVAGSSSVFSGGWVTYSNEMKSRELGVDSTLIEKHGAVSEPVAASMAQHAREKAGADLGIGITGIAGPGGGTADKPVGTVWIGLADKNQTLTRCFVLGADREQIRDRAAKAAMQMMRLHVLGESLDLIVTGRRTSV